MKEELDTSWFDLKKYDKLSELDLIGWYTQLDFRKVMLYCGLTKEQSEPFILRIKENPIIANYDNSSTVNYNNLLGFEESDYLYPFSSFSVKNATTLYITPECANIVSRPLFSQQELTNPPQNFIFSFLDTRLNNTNKSLANVTIDLQATNEQIISDFKHWLTEYRKVADYPAIQKKDSSTPLKAFTEKERAEWVKHRILPYIDLRLIAEFEGKKIKKDTLAELIFPDEYFSNPDEKIKKTIKPIADWLLSEATRKAIEAQLGNLSSG